MGPDSYADVLRAVGLFLDHQDAERVEVLADPYQWSVGWGQSPSITLEPADLEALRVVARLHRGLPPRRAYLRPGRFRAMGQLFDQMGASCFTITEAVDGYQVSARVAEQEGARFYRTDEIAALVEQRTSRRAQ